MCGNGQLSGDLAEASYSRQGSQSWRQSHVLQVWQWQSCLRSHPQLSAPWNPGPAWPWQSSAGHRAQNTVRAAPIHSALSPSLLEELPRSGRRACSRTPLCRQLSACTNAQDFGLLDSRQHSRRWQRWAPCSEELAWRLRSCPHSLWQRARRQRAWQWQRSRPQWGRRGRCPPGSLPQARRSQSCTHNHREHFFSDVMRVYHELFATVYLIPTGLLFCAGIIANKGVKKDQTRW